MRWGRRDGGRGRGAEEMHWEEAEVLDEAGARRGGAGGGSRWGALLGAWGRGSPGGVPGWGWGGRYLKLGGEARCNPRNGEEAGGDAAPFSRSAILWLSPCRRRAGGREGGRQERREREREGNAGSAGGEGHTCRRVGGGEAAGAARGLLPGIPTAAAGQMRSQLEVTPRTPSPAAPIRP